MPITDEELKAIFRANDYTTYVPKYDAKTATAVENRIHSRAKSLFYKAFLPVLLFAGAEECFRPDVPARRLQRSRRFQIP